MASAEAVAVVEVVAAAAKDSAMGAPKGCAAQRPHPKVTGAAAVVIGATSHRHCATMGSRVALRSRDNHPRLHATTMIESLVPHSEDPPGLASRWALPNLVVMKAEWALKVMAAWARVAKASHKRVMVDHAVVVAAAAAVV